MPAGRPTKYKPEFCEMLINHGETGLSFEAFAGKIEVAKDTLYEWVKKHKEFSDAKKLFEAKSRVWWEQQGIDGLWDQTHYDDEGKPMMKKKLNASVWIINMKNRHGYRDKVETEIVDKRPIKEAYNIDEDE